MQKSSLVKVSPSVRRNDCNVCSVHLEAFGSFGLWFCQTPPISLETEGWSCRSRVCEYNSRLSFFFFISFFSSRLN